MFSKCNTVLFFPIRDQIFHELTDAKRDVSDLSNEQLLRKDVKVVSGGGLTTGMASLPMSVRVSHKG